eukprot:TRINITY_DN111415_c0_g1_i1.p1 TRINITY_DN111415_c0_g1~~TRINITY_DN111415_c0_g1_i1.p1  ORF type:complete len:508 (-),score=126.34 TRINITY_DN111415_c0_g1_i1:100-1623(-)
MSAFSGIISDVSCALDNVVSNLGLGAKGASLQKEQDKRKAVVLAAALFVILQFEIYQLVFMVAGAFCYWLTQGAPTPRLKKAAYAGKRASSAGGYCGANASNPTARGAAAKKMCTASPNTPTAAPSSPSERKACKTQTVMPIEAPVFKSAGFDDEVKELLSQIEPNTMSKAAVRELASLVQKTIQHVIPEAKVVGLSPSDFRKSKAFGVAVPEVDVVVNVHPTALARRLNTGRLDAAKLHKAAIRTIAEMLVSAAGFKFRRSAFRGLEPKITLLAPALAGLTADSISLDLSVNSTIPFHGNALIANAGRVEAQAKDLILFVRRWARDRGVCHAAKGHLSLYVWTVMAIYFLQVNEDDKGSLLPSLAEMEKRTITGDGSKNDNNEKKADIGALFKAFVRFYTTTFNWRKEAVSICAARRASPPLEMPLHVIAQDGIEEVAVAPSIVDPLDKTRNLSESMTRESLVRLKEEFARAAELSQRGASLSELLELWSPPEHEKDSNTQDGSNQ